MSLIKIQSPDTLTPAYNQMIWVFNSTLVNKLSFRYVVTISDKNNNRIAKLPVAPEPTIGYGYVDISKIINSQVSYDLNVGLTTSMFATNSVFEYKINCSEEYIYTWDFFDTTFVAGGITRYNGNTPHNLQIGDELQIDITNPNSGGINYQFAAGLHKIVAKTSTTFDVVNNFISTPSNPGTVYLSDRSKVNISGATYSDYYAFNGRESFRNFIDYDESKYEIPLLGSSTTNLLTDMPSTFNCTLEQDLFINAGLQKYIFNTTDVIFRNSNGDLLKKPLVNGVNGYIKQFSAGPNNHGATTVVSGTGPLIKPDTTYYEFWLRNGSQTKTQVLRINLDRRCKIEDYEILFLDRKGSFISYAFQLRSKETGTVERDTYNQFLGGIGNDGWSYNRQSAGNTIYSINYDKELELITNFMNDDMSVFFEQLLTSPVTLLKDTDGEYYQVIVQDNGFETIRQKNKVLIKKSIKVRFANKEIGNI